MSRRIASYLYFLTGIINLIVSILYFKMDKTSWGFVYVFLALTFIFLGVFYRKRDNKK